MWTLAVDVGDAASWQPNTPYVALLTLTFAQGTTSAPRTVEYPFELASGVKRRRGTSTEYEFETCRVQYSHEAEGGGSSSTGTGESGAWPVEPP